MKRSTKEWSLTALLFTIGGSIVIIIGQLAGIMLPIMWGAQDFSDFSITLNHSSAVFDGESSSHIPQRVDFAVTDIHHWLRPYRFNIFFRALGAINDSYAIFNPEEISFLYSPLNLLNDTIKCNVTIQTNLTKIGVYPIVIQGIGGERWKDAKRHAFFGN
jgi:hypothetical protein